MHRGWHTRGYLRHVDLARAVQSVSFRLVDAVPADVIEQWREELGLRADAPPPSHPRRVALQKRVDRYEDQGRGACWLRHPEIAGVVERALLAFDGERYRLLAWCVMPNHVHAMIETFPGHPLGRVVHSWKSFTAHACNRRLGRSGRFWMPDYFDRVIRDEAHFHAAMLYIEANPVEAGICGEPEEWLFGSARRRSWT